jgi:hypothetical protein
LNFVNQFQELEETEDRGKEEIEEYWLILSINSLNNTKFDESIIENAPSYDSDILDCECL